MVSLPTSRHDALAPQRFFARSGLLLPYDWIKRSFMSQSVEETKNCPVQGTELVAPHPVELVAPLSDSETKELNRCEEVLRLGLGTFFEVGNALLTIRDLRLYRQTHPNFESYCHE